MISVNDKTSGHLVGPDGSLLYRPTTIIGADAAAIMRAYFFWAMSNQLEPELFCGACFDGLRENKAQYNITEQEIEIVCKCQMRVCLGASLPMTPVSPSMTAPANATGIVPVVLSEAAARLLRLYKKVLIDLNLKEALRCNVCYEVGEDGCAASVTSQSIRIDCRCSERRYAGLTI